MNKQRLIVIVISIVLFSLCLIPSSTPEPEQFLRIHIRANSNTTSDQNIKLIVKDAVVVYLSGIVENIETKEEAKRTVASLLDDITVLSNDVLSSRGFSYTAKARLASERFPEKNYDGLVLSEGDYDALIIELGEGAGDNWWCVIYPPLCFVYGEDNGTDKIQYRSAILDFLKKLFK